MKKVHQNFSEATQRTVFDVFQKSAIQYPVNDVVYIPEQATRKYAQSKIVLSYEEALSRSLELASLYKSSGVGVGVRIALLLENRVNFFVHFLALNSIGASIVPVSAEFSESEIAYLLDHGDVKLIVTLPEYVAKTKAAIALTSSELALVIDDGRSLSIPEIKKVDSNSSYRGIEGGSQSEMTEAALLYTSGTTGKPKGCILSNEYFIGNGRWYASQRGICEIEPGRERLITPLPLNHSNALAWSFMGMIQSGGCVIQLDRFHPSSWWETVKQSRATIIHYLGVMPAMLLNQPATDSDDFSGQIKFGFGAGVDPRHHKNFEKRHGFPLIEAWAMTETGAGAIVAANEEPRHVGTRCFGKPAAGIEYRLITEQGADAEVNEPGELLVRRSSANRAKYFFNGYYKDVKATDEAWLDGWFHTGDVVKKDQQGYLYFVDRKKNIIRRSGENIAAIEVEAVLLKHSAIKHCAIVPVSDEIRGEEVAACIILNSGFEADNTTATSLFSACMNELAYYKAPGYVIVFESLPETASNKVRRNELKALAEARVESGKVFDMTKLKKRPQGHL